MQKQNQSGQGLVEYVILLALVALVTVSASKRLGTQINHKIQDIREKIDSGVPVRLSPSGDQ